MKAVQFNLNLARYAFVKLFGKWFPAMHWNTYLSCLSMKNVNSPILHNEEWIKIDVKYGGICGSDLNLIFLRDSPVTSPYASFPFTLGHELIGSVLQTGSDVTHVHEGDRVVVDPILSCKSRMITEVCPACLAGNESLCENKHTGDLSPGLLIGACKDTGGSWSKQLVSHHSQVLKLPDAINDYNGIMVEPFSCAIHSILRYPPKADDNVLIIGAGVIGICTVAALRALGYNNSITVVAKHPFQEELAKHYGADHVVRYKRSVTFQQELCDLLKAKTLKPVFGDLVIQGGAETVYECVGNKTSIQDALRFAQSGGKIVLVGLASIIPKLDWTYIWLNELRICGSFAYSIEEYKGKKMRTLQIAIDLLAQQKVDLAPLVTHVFPLDQYKDALKLSTRKGTENTMKILLQP